MAIKIEYAKKGEKKETPIVLGGIYRSLENRSICILVMDREERMHMISLDDEGAGAGLIDWEDITNAEIREAYEYLPNVRLVIEGDA